MKGHEAVIKMRTVHKLKPSAVFIDDFDCGGIGKTPSMPSISIKGDAIEMLDLRFLVGLVVHGSASTEKRAQALLQRVIEASPSMVSVLHFPDGGYLGDEYLKVWTKEDGFIYG